jgi:subfamily B ATP-binding cassette protein HlyB/CyaB
MGDNLPLSAESFVWALGSICRFNGIPFNPSLVLKEFPPPYKFVTLKRAAASLGPKVGLRSVKPLSLAQSALPCIAFLKETFSHPRSDAEKPSPLKGEGKGEGDISLHCRFALIVKADSERVLYFEAGSDVPHVIPISEFRNLFESEVLLFKPEAAPLKSEEGLPTKQFGFRWFLPGLLKHKPIWRDVLAASLVIQLMALATPLFTQIVIDKVIVHHTQSTLAVIAVGLAVFLVFTAALSWVRQYLVLHTGNRVDAVLGSRVFAHLFRLPIRYFERRPTGTLIARLHGMESIREFISGAAVTLILDFPFMFIFLAAMFWYNATLSLIALGLLLLMAVLSLAVTPVLRKRLNEQFLLAARNQAFLTEYVAGMETVKSLQMEPQLEKRYGEYFSTYLAASFRTRQLSNSFNVLANMLEQILTLAILCVGAWIVMTSTEFTIGMLVAFQMFASRLSGPVLRMVGLWQEFQQAAIAVKRLGDVMDAPMEPYSLLASREGVNRGKIEIKNLSFRYADNLPFLYQHFDLTVQPGALVALMGPSGSGKSTLAKLLQGFYQPNEGQILIDGRDIRYLSVNELRGHFGIVPQETTLFSGTIYDNLLLGQPHASFEQMIQACKLAEIHEVIEALPEGYQTQIGEHGAGLSGGQKQRLAIARALLKRPRMLIFDEAASHLDPATAAHCAQTINRLKGKVTILFIAHQLPKGLQVDEVRVLGSTQSNPIKQSTGKGGKENE